MFTTTLHPFNFFHLFYLQRLVSVTGAHFVSLGNIQGTQPPLGNAMFTEQ